MAQIPNVHLGHQLTQLFQLKEVQLHGLVVEVMVVHQRIVQLVVPLLQLMVFVAHQTIKTLHQLQQQIFVV
jgi:hypothetical protein